MTMIDGDDEDDDDDDENLCSQSVDEVVPVPPSLSSTPSLLRPRFCDAHDDGLEQNDDDLEDEDDDYEYEDGQPGM